MERGPKRLATTRAIAEAATALGMTPSEVLATDPVLLHEMIALRNERTEAENQQAREQELRQRLDRKMKR